MASFAPQIKKVVAEDTFMSLGQQIASANKQETYAALEVELNTVNETFIVVGGRLSLVQANEWFLDEGYTNLRQFIEEKLNLDYRRAMYWIKIYNTMLNAGVSWDKVKVMGWSKLRELCSVEGLLTDDNALQWVEKSQNLNFKEFKDEVRKAKKAKQVEDGKEVDIRPTTMKFNVHDDQRSIIADALEQVKSELHTDHDSVALEAICGSYINGEREYKFDLTSEERGEVDYKDLKNQVEVAANKGMKVRTFALNPEGEKILDNTMAFYRQNNNLDDDGDVLENICMDAMEAAMAPKSEAKAAPQKTLREMMNETTWENVLEIFGELWKDIDITVEV